MEYMEDIGQSSSKSTAFIARSLWGSDFTLSFAAKLLQRPIYVLVVRHGMENPCYQVFKPSNVSTTDFILDSAKGVMISEMEPQIWLELLQAECRDPHGQEHLPIVLKYGAEHYSLLRFGTGGSEPQTETEMNVQRVVEEAEQSKTEDLSPPMHLTKQDSTTESDNVDPQLLAAFKQPGHTEGGRKKLQDTKDYGGSRKEEFFEFSTAGAFGLAPVVQKLLLELDWDNPSQLQALETMTEADSDTLNHWQQQLYANEVGSASTPEDSDVEMDGSQDFSWSPPPKIEKSITNKNPEPPDIHEELPPNVGSGRFSAHRNTASAGRREENNQRDQWNAQEKDWMQISSLIFPALPADLNTWKNAVEAHPTPLLQSLQNMDSPEFIVRSINAKVLQEWTRRYRVDCLIQGLSELHATKVDETTQADLSKEIDYLKAQRDDMTDDLYIHGRDYWIKLRKYDPDKNELLKRCRKARSTHLARLIVAAFAYGPELAKISGRPFSNVSTTVPLIKSLLWILDHDSGIKKAFYAQDSDGDLAGLKSALASRTSSSQIQPDAVEE